MQILPSWRASFQKAFVPIFLLLKTYLCLNPCALLAWLLCRVLGLVKVGNKGFHLGRGRYEWGVFTSRFKTDISRLIPSLSWNKKRTEAFSVRGGLLSEVFTRRSLRRYFSRRSTKQQWQVHRGDTFQPQGLTPAPMTRRTSTIFSPRRFCLLVWTIFWPRKKKKPKHSEQICARRFVSVYLYQPSPQKVLFCASVSSCQCTIFFSFFFLIIIGFVLDFYLVLCIEMQKVYWK